MVTLSQADSIAVQVLAIFGAVFWSIQLLPQIYLNYSRKSTEGLHSSMMILWAAAGLPLGIHNILSRQHIALQIQAQILTALSLATWSQTVYYGKKWSIRKCVWSTTALVLLFTGIETAFVVGFKYGDVSESTLERVILAMAVLSALGLALGVLRHYLDIYQERTVRGISWGFVMLDAAGDLTSLLAIVLKSPVDTVAVGIYATELGLWIGIMIAGLVYNLPRAIKRSILRRRSLSLEAAPPISPANTVAATNLDQPNGSDTASLTRTMSAFNSIVRSEANGLPSYQLRNRAPQML